ncbi:MAG: exosortase/archaeosortase family protein [Phycisphaerales bacterium]|nr:exosortase/archaeosortase family protein [Phycisphaerales bacterium]
MDPQTEELNVSPGRAMAALALLVLVLVGLFWHFVAAQAFYSWSYLGDWGHTFLVPLITAYLVWIERDRLLARPFVCAPVGFIVVLTGILLYMLTVFGPGFLQVHNAKAIGVAVTLFGVAIVACGWSAMRVLWFPLLYLVAFGQFISAQILAPVTDRMQDIATTGSFFMFEIMGFETVRVGNLITLESDGQTRPLDVAEACSGMKMLMAFLAMGTFIAWTGLPRLWQRVVLVALGLPIAIVVNILRITTQGILDTWDAGLSVGAAHSTISMLWLIPALLLYLFFLWVLEGFAPEDESPEPEPVESVRVERSAPRIYWMLVMLLAVSAVGVHVVAASTGMRSIKGAAPLRGSLDALPQVIGDWVKVGDDLVYTDTVVEVLGTELYIDRSYARDGDPRNGVFQVHVAFYTGGATNRPHVPERCWAVHGMTASRDPDVIALEDLQDAWAPGEMLNLATGEPYPVATSIHPVTGREELVHLPVGEHRLRVTLFADPANPEMRMVGGYFFIANGRLTPNALAVRRLAYNFSDTHAYFCKVQFTLRAIASDREDDEIVTFYVDEIEDLMQDLMPELMKLLPDWPAYEQRSED